jgi:hypothetical protein
MPARVARKFTVIDAILLIAATALGFVPMKRLFYANGASVRPEVWTVASAYEYAPLLVMSLAPMVIAWSAALWLLRLADPRPAVWQTFRQPGMAATTAILISALYFLIKFTYWAGVLHFQQGIKASEIADMYLSPMCWSRYLNSGDISVPVVWMILWLGRVGRPEPSWIDRSGRVLGIYCVICSLLFGSYNFFIG